MSDIDSTSQPHFDGATWWLAQLAVRWSVLRETMSDIISKRMAFVVLCRDM